METVAFYSYKGGVGRSLLLANTAKYLAASGARVVALDLDLEAPGLHYKLCDEETRKGLSTGIVDYLLAILEERPTDIRDASIEIPLPPESTGFLRLIPAGPAPSLAYLSSIQRLNAVLDLDRRQRLIGTLLEVQAQIENAFAPDYVLVDSRTGITELGELATSILADRLVGMTTLSPESLDGTSFVLNALVRAPRPDGKSSLDSQIVVARVPIPKGASDGARYPNVILPSDNAAFGWDHFPPIRIGQEPVDSPLMSETVAWIKKAFPLPNRQPTP